MSAIERVNAAALRQYEVILSSWFPAGKVRGREFTIGDITGKAGKSMSINLDSGVGKDFASGQTFKDPIELCAQLLHGGDITKALHDLGKRTGAYLNGSAPVKSKEETLRPARPRPPKEQPQPTKSSDEWEALIPPVDFPEPDLSSKGYDAIYRYVTEDGHLVRIIARTDVLPDGGKGFSQWSYGRNKGEVGWHQLGWRGNGKHLFGLDALTFWSDETVIVCEGEKATLAARKLFPKMPCITWSGGSSSVRTANWEPLRDRRVVIWPDNDEPGHKAADVLASILRPMVYRLAILKVSDLVGADGKGQDAADIQPDEPASWLWGRVEWLPNDTRLEAPEIDYSAEILLPDAEPEAVAEPEAPKRKGLTFVSFADLKPHLSTADFIKGLLVEGAMSVVYGESNSGKTFFVTDLAMRLANGRPWRGTPTKTAGVLYLALEGGFGISNRVEAFKVDQHLDDANPPFAVVTQPVPFFEAPGEAAEAIVDTVRQIERDWAAGGIKLKLIVIDTLSRAMAGGNENDSRDMTTLIGCSDRIRKESEAHILWIHHSGKDTAKGARGHSSLRAATDTEIEVGAEGHARTATVTKQRDMPKDGLFPFQLRQVEIGLNDEGEKVFSCVVDEGHPAEADDEPQTSKLSATTEKLKRFLSDLVMSEGKPRHTMAGAMALFEKRAREAWIASHADEDEKAARQTWYRGIKTLEAHHIVVRRDAFLSFIRAEDET